MKTSVSRLPTPASPKTATLPAVRVEPKLLNDLEAVLGETETISAFVEHAVREAVKYRRTQLEFLARGEQAWHEYRHTGQSRPAGEVLDKIQERIDARRQELPEPRRIRHPLGDANAEMPGGDKNLSRALAELPCSRKSGGVLPGVDPGSNWSLLDAADDIHHDPGK